MSLNGIASARRKGNVGEASRFASREPGKPGHFAYIGLRRWKQRLSEVPGAFGSNVASANTAARKKNLEPLLLKYIEDEDEFEHEDD